MRLVIRPKSPGGPNPEPRSQRRFDWLEAFLLLSIILLLAQLVPEARRFWNEWPRPGRQTSGRVALQDAKHLGWEVQYYVYLPTDYAAKPRWPLLLYLHGAGQRGDDVQQVLRWGLPQLIDQGLEVPMIVVSPQCRDKVSWDAQQLLAFLDRVEDRFPIDPDRIYVSGESMGGYGTWMLGATAPERFAAAVPICGGGNVKLAQALTKLPIWSFHGAKDTVVPIKHSQDIVDAVEAAGGDVRLTVFPEGGHGISDLVYTRKDLFTWLLEHERPH